mmetsp:Transcript_5905/g.25080  ORF Transcript_5905/g.25080 Transcript_5905/m.25080 type:complete len:393 (+) Transcript_5905:697-1875(+)
MTFMYASMEPLEPVPSQNACRPESVKGTAHEDDWDMPKRTGELKFEPQWPSKPAAGTGNPSTSRDTASFALDAEGSTVTVPAINGAPTTYPGDPLLGIAVEPDLTNFTENFCRSELGSTDGTTPVPAFVIHCVPSAPMASVYTSSTLTAEMLPAPVCVTVKCASATANSHTSVAASYVAAGDVTPVTAVRVCSFPPTRARYFMELTVGAMYVGELPFVSATRRLLIRLSELSVEPVQAVARLVSGTSHSAASSSIAEGRGKPNPTTLVYPHTPEKVFPGSVNTFPGAPVAAMVSFTRYSSDAAAVAFAATAAATAVGSGLKNLPISLVRAVARSSVVANPGSVKYFPSSALLLSTMHSCCERKDMDASLFVTTLSVLLDSRFTLDIAEDGTQ